MDTLTSSRILKNMPRLLQHAPRNPSLQRQIRTVAYPSHPQSKISTRGTRLQALAATMTKPLRRGGASYRQPQYLSPRLLSFPLTRLCAIHRQRDLARQLKADPLSSIPSHLKRPLHSLTAIPPPQSHSYSQSQQSQKSPPSSASREGRLARESAERERALALLRRKQREREQAERATATPSTVNGGSGGPGYVDVFNRREVEDAHQLLYYSRSMHASAHK